MNVKYATTGWFHDSSVGSRVSPAQVEATATGGPDPGTTSGRSPGVPISGGETTADNLYFTRSANNGGKINTTTDKLLVLLNQRCMTVLHALVFWS